MMAESMEEGWDNRKHSSPLYGVERGGNGGADKGEVVLLPEAEDVEFIGVLAGGVLST